jgi:stage II sporulation protein M
MAVLFGVLMLGVVIGLLTTIGQGQVALSRDRLFAGNTPADFTVAGIFLHNALIAVAPVLLFPVLFWGPPASMGLTGFVVGRLAGIWQAMHLPNGALILVLVPHGVIEIPSFLVAGTIAWRLGWSSWDSARFGGTWWTRVRAGSRVALPLLALVVAALAVAATIEVKVTPDLVRSVFPDV